MAQPTTTYDPKKVVVTFGGVPLTGFADGTFISIEPVEEAFTRVSGADGLVSRARSNDDGYEVTLTLQQTSLSNAVLSGIHNQDKRTGDGVKPLTVKDLRGEQLFFAEAAWIRQDPTVEYSKEIEEREWVFDTGRAEQFVAGSEPPEA